MSYYVNGCLRETLKEANMRYVGCIAPKLHLLEDKETGQYEVWVAYKGSAGAAIVWNNTELEFVRSALSSDLEAVKRK